MFVRLREDDGFSLITAVLISVVVFILSLTTIALSAHNSTQSGRNRERVNAIAAAEAGINYQFSKLQSGTFQCTHTMQLGGFPASSFSTQLLSSDDTPLTCPPPPGPHRLLIRSVGRATGSDPVRTMEALVDLAPRTGGPFGEGALFADGDILIDSNAGVGDPDGDYNADVYANGSITLDNGANVAGSLFAQKFVVMKNNAMVQLDVLAKGISSTSETILMDSNTKVLRDATAATGRIRFNSSAKVFGDARAGGTMNPWPPGAHVGGSAAQNQTGLSGPTFRPFPAFTFDQAEWEDPNLPGGPYEVQYFNQSGEAACSEAKNAIGSSNTVKRVIRISPSTCLLKWDRSADNPITIGADLAIITDGPLMLDSDTHFIASSEQKMHFITGLNSPTDTCFEMKSNSRVESPITSLVYVPKIGMSTTRCRVFLDSNTSLARGQIFGNKLDLKSNTTMTYVPVDTPGAGSAGYEEDILYIREVKSS